MGEWARKPELFLETYKRAHQLLSELGAKFVVEKGVPAVAEAKKKTNLVTTA
jgi:hypothetical protein